MKKKIMARIASIVLSTVLAVSAVVATTVETKADDVIHKFCTEPKHDAGIGSGHIFIKNRTMTDSGRNQNNITGMDAVAFIANQILDVTTFTVNDFKERMAVKL